MQTSGGVKPYLRIALIAHTPTMLGHSLKSVGNSNTHPTALQSTVRCSLLASAFEPSIVRTWTEEINSHESECSFLGNWQRLTGTCPFPSFIQLFASQQRSSTIWVPILVDEVLHTQLDRIAAHGHLNTFPDSCYSLPQSNWYIYMMWHTVEIAEVLVISCWKFYSSPMTKYMEGDCNLHWTFRLVCHHSPAYWELDAWIQFRAVFPWDYDSPEYSANWEK